MSKIWWHHCPKCRRDSLGRLQGVDVFVCIECGYMETPAGAAQASGAVLVRDVTPRGEGGGHV